MNHGGLTRLWWNWWVSFPYLNLPRKSFFHLCREVSPIIRSMRRKLSTLPLCGEKNIVWREWRNWIPILELRKLSLITGWFNFTLLDLPKCEGKDDYRQNHKYWVYFIADIWSRIIAAEANTIQVFCRRSFLSC